MTREKTPTGLPSVASESAEAREFELITKKLHEAKEGIELWDQVGKRIEYQQMTIVRVDNETRSRRDLLERMERTYFEKRIAAGALPAVNALPKKQQQKLQQLMEKMG